MATDRTPRRVAVVVACVAALSAAAVGGASAINGDDDAQDQPIPARDLERAEQAALQQTGGGMVTETEVGDEDSLYEVEVTLDNGTQVDVQLDEKFVVVGAESDDVGSDGSDD